MSPARNIFFGLALAGIVAAPVLGAPLIRTITGSEAGADVARFLSQPANRVVPQLLKPAVDPSKLVRFRDRDYLADHDGSVSMVALGTTTVRKIAGGEVFDVVVVQTPSGTYSNEALVSPHVRYRGVTVLKLPDLPEGFAYAPSQPEQGIDAAETPVAGVALETLPQAAMLSRGSFVVLPPLLRCPSSNPARVCI